MVKDIMKQNLQLSEVITIDTQENRCAIAFAMELQLHLPSAPRTLFITGNRAQLVRDNLKIVSDYLEGFEHVHQNTSYLFLKESWSELHDRYGIQAFINELRTLTDNDTYDLFYFHRIDLFFDKAFNDEIEEAVLALIESVRYHHKKIFFSYNTQTVSGKSFERVLQNHRDLSFDVVPNNDGECDLTMKTHNRLLQKGYVSILLISDQPSVKRMHKYILEGEPDIRFKTLSLAQLQSGDEAIDPQTDLIIYNDSIKLLDAEMTAELKKIAPDAQIFWLTGRKSIRKSDITKSKEIGIEMLFPKTFDIREYMHAIEHAVQKQFYSHKLDNLSYLNDTQIVNIQDLPKRLSELQSKRILFSVVTVNASHIHEENIPSLIRKEDFVFIDAEHDVVLFVLVNLPEEHARQIIAHRVNVNPLMVKYHNSETLTQLLREDSR